MFGIVAEIVEKSIPCQARSDYWRRAMTPRGVDLLIAAPVAAMIVAGWALGLSPNDPEWLALTLLPMALTALNIGLDGVIRRGRRELRRGLELSGARIQELARIIKPEIQKAYQDSIAASANRAAPSPDQGNEAVHLPPPRPRLASLTLAPRILPIPRVCAFHSKGIGRA
jgi:hypothetical protein